MITRAITVCVLLVTVSALLSGATHTLADVRAAITRGDAVIELPAGETKLDSPIVIGARSKPLTLRGAKTGSTLIGAAAIVIEGATNVTLSGLRIRGNRTELKSDWYLPPGETPFADYYTDNGIVIRRSRHVTITNVGFSQIRAFAVLANASDHVLLDSLHIEDSGTLNRNGRNNTTGGILFEEGSSDFEVRNSTITRITGNAIWTHSYAHSPRNTRGVIRNNTITEVARDAIQAGHATNIRIENNRGSRIGFPADQVDYESHGIGVALDTAGNVDASVYSGNVFTDVDGQCVNLDGFHDGRIENNTCTNRQPADAYPFLHAAIVFGNNDPNATASNITITGNTADGFAYGGIYMLGENNRIENNHLLNLNQAHCGTTPTPAKCAYAPDQPDLLRAGIYLANSGGRPATTRGNIIRNNELTGFGIAEHCIAPAPGVRVEDNTIANNNCH